MDGHFAHGGLQLHLRPRYYNATQACLARYWDFFQFDS